MKILSGSELVSFIKVRQAKQVRMLRQAHKINPKLAIVQTVDNPVIDKYVSLKQRYGQEILIDVEHHKVDQAEAKSLINSLNADESVHGIIVQLPLEDDTMTDELLNLVDSAKDVDGLGESGTFTPATPMAIDWLIAGYNVDLAGKNIVLVGNGRLVGAPLFKLWQAAGRKVDVVDDSTINSAEIISQADVIVSAAGVPGLIRSEIVKLGAVVVDAGTSSEHGKILGDVADDVREREDVSLTPTVGGVGPLTVAALFDNVIRAALKLAETK
ncbi:MAG: bifunctional 5,10-methylenetetrahydrofolate dehydrogenase/5,10-methenyltetrahydrofolate cyclohydrolase [bacterium]|nr:bifunctional 5,10-methylenetetrahydrofolate dehydrogenase/5,10-methenyltetrahydrofolate cyclohydrolase [bacterium]MDN5835638.1 bifunctional 5,10-methylenetetrahydrofolate dehydrogenase/5,10-methenyltetrahydrofolate cyclohydrolase [bacterium]